MMPNGNTDIIHTEYTCTVEKQITGYCLNAASHAVLPVLLLLALHLPMDHWLSLIHPGMRYLMRLVTKKTNPTYYVQYSNSIGIFKNVKELHPYHCYDNA